MAPKKDKKTKTKTKTKQKQKQKQTQKVIVNVGTAAVRQARRNKRPAGSRAPTERTSGPAPPNVLAPPPLPMAPPLGHINQAGAGVGLAVGGIRPAPVENTNTMTGGNVTVNVGQAKAKTPKKVGVVAPELGHETAATPRTRTKAKMAETKAIQDEAPIARRVKARREIERAAPAPPELEITGIVRAAEAPVNKRSIAQQARWARVRQAPVAPVPEFSTPAASGDTELSHQAL